MKKDSKAEEFRSLFLDMCPEMISKIHDMIADPNTPAASKVQLIGMVLERGLGKAETPITLTTNKEAIEEAEAELAVIVDEIQTENEEEESVGTQEDE